MRVYLCLSLPESCLAVIIGSLLVGYIDLPGRPWISLASNFVRLKWHSFALWHYSFCVIPVSTFAQIFILSDSQGMW